MILGMQYADDADLCLRLRSKLMDADLDGIDEGMLHQKLEEGYGH